MGKSKFFSYMSQAGEIHILEALRGFVKTHSTDEAVACVEKMAEAVWQGHSIVPVMRQYPDLFFKDEIDLVEKGEKDGNLFQYFGQLSK